MNIKHLTAFIAFLLIVFNLTAQASTLLNYEAINYKASDPDQDKIIEISDKYSEVKLGLTSSSVYMVISEEIRSKINKNLKERFSKITDSFVDSHGTFIIGDFQPLTSSRIEYNLEDIREITYKNGTINFEYKYHQEVKFEDVIALNGNRALSNFEKSDLINFIKHYKNIR